MQVQRESIFVSAIRSFCRMFFAICGLFLAVLTMSILYGSFFPGEEIETKTKVKYIPDAEGKLAIAPPTAPVVLQIDVKGVIGQPKGIDTARVQSILTESRMETLKSDRVKAILLYMDTPGGTVFDSDNIYRLIKEYKARYNVPVYAYVGGLCASGGMYIACSADKVFAGPASIIGSVGVIIGPFFNVVGAMEKFGVKSETITAGLDKDMMTPFRPWKADEDASLKAVTQYFYGQFVNLVTENRPRIDKNKLVQQYGAKVFDPEQALANGYVDEINATRESTLLALLSAAEIDSAQPYQVISLDQKGDWSSAFLSEQSPLFTGKIEHVIEGTSNTVRDKISYLYQPSTP